MYIPGGSGDIGGVITGEPSGEASALLTDPDEMRRIAGLLGIDTDNITEATTRAMAASNNATGVSWHGTAEVASNTSMLRITQLLRGITDQLGWTINTLTTSATTYEMQQAENTTLLT